MGGFALTAVFSFFSFSHWGASPPNPPFVAKRGQAPFMAPIGGCVVLSPSPMETSKSQNWHWENGNTAVTHIVTHNRKRSYPHSYPQSFEHSPQTAPLPHYTHPTHLQYGQKEKYFSLVHTRMVNAILKGGLSAIMNMLKTYNR